MFSHRITYKILGFICVLTLCFGIGSGTVSAEEVTSTDQQEDPVTENRKEVHWQDYNGKKLGVLVGPLMEDAAAKFFPDSEYLYFDSYPECATALLSKKIDAFIGDEPGIISMHAEQPLIDYIPERLTENNYSFAFRKNDPESAALCEELNEFLEKCWADGTMKELRDIWLGKDEARKIVDMSGLTGENGTVRVATTSTDMPWSYIKDGKYVGYDIDLVVRFCRDRGYALELGDMDFAGRIPAIQSGKYDFSTDMNVTPEREEQVLFSSPTSEGGFVLAVRSEDLLPLSPDDSSEETELDEMARASIGVLSGTLFPEIVKEYLPDAEILLFNSTRDELAALKSGKVDALALDEPVARNMQAEDQSLKIFSKVLGSMEYAYILNRSEEGESFRAELNVYLQELKSDGTMEALQEKWLDSPNLSDVEMTDYRGLPDTKGRVHLAMTSGYPPFAFQNDGMYCGYEVELIAMFCRDRGYALEISDMSFDAVLSAVQSGKCDIGCDCITVTEERKQSILFSDPDYIGGTALLVLKDRVEKKESFLSSIVESFNKTFIRENRWLLFVKGIGVTLLITAASVILGTALGFGLYILCRNGNRIANVITRFSIWLVQGMPIVVLLMVLYYIIFGKVEISGTAVSIVGFTLVFGAAMYGMLRSGIGAVDQGQTEAAYALGYTDRKAFFRIILPQALPHFMPAYKGEITSLIKATAVVGYVAVKDLTKMGDIVRSRTYEAFFPLIAVAAIYFILAAILTFIVNKIEIRIDPRRRSQKSILKGVELR